MEMASESKIRAFLALPLAPIFEADVSRLIEKLKNEYSQIRWVHPSQIHATFHFFGPIKPREIETISKAVSRVVSKTKPFSIFLSGMGGFPDLGRSRLIWLGMGGETERLGLLQVSLERELKKEGFPCEERPFKAHLTLGRAKERGGFQGFRPLEFGPTETKRISEIVLFQSQLTPGGAIYESIKTYPLSAT